MNFLSNCSPVALNEPNDQSQRPPVGRRQTADRQNLYANRFFGGQSHREATHRSSVGGQGRPNLWWGEQLPF